jgi:type IV pilus assembly protein PilA
LFELIQIQTFIQEFSMLKQVQQGFTLIELMIVIAIIGILAAIAIPAYQNYTIRAQVTEGLTLADGWKTAVSEFYAVNGTFPSGSSATGSSTQIVEPGVTSGKYVSGIAVGTGGSITVTFSGSQVNSKLSGYTLALNPGVSANNDVVWVCGAASTPSGTSAVASGVTNVPVQYLPASCHA